MQSEIIVSRAPRAIGLHVPEGRVNGHLLRDLNLTGTLYGRPLGTAPVWMVVGGITASPLPFGDGEAEGWWPALARPGLIDLTQHTVLCPALPGHGTHWRGLEDAAVPLPALSVLDLADLVAAWLDGIGCERRIRYVGASLGGLIGLALAARHPSRIERLVSISAGLRPDGWGTGVRHLQRELVRDGIRNDDVATGMSRARQLGMLTYRGRAEINARFGVLSPEKSRPPVAAYLDHHGSRFAESFSSRAFLLLSEAIDRCHLAESPTATRESLENIVAEVAIVGVPGDILFPWELQNELFRELQAAGVASSLWKLDSVYGHDAFLADQATLAEVLADTSLFQDGTAPQRYTPIGPSPLRRIRLGLIGCGVVGQGLLELLARQTDSLAERYGVRFEVAQMAVRDLDRDRGPHAAGIPRCDDALQVVSNPAVDVIVEVAGGLQMEAPLFAALAAGKPVVTANKELVARNLAELAILGHRTATPLACEAATAAALPILRSLSHRADDIESLMAIVNGTTNFVLTRMEQDELSLEEAVGRAQSLGLAEADPSADIDGLDAASKLSILSYRSFGAWVRPTDFVVRGIRGIEPADCDLAEAMGFRIRHIARAALFDGELEMAVEPVLLPEWHLLASIEEEYNAVYLACTSAGDLSFFGKGAGGLPTATAVLGDLIDLAQDNKARWPAPRSVPLCGERARRHYVRVSGERHPGLARRVEGHLRRGGPTVQSRASRVEEDRIYLGFLISPQTDAALAATLETIVGLVRVESVLWLGLVD